MMKFYLAVNYGYEEWALKEYPSAQEAIKAAQSGENAGYEWKILKELPVTVEDNNK